MKDFFKKIKLFSVGKKVRTGIYEREGIRPAKDWRTMLITTSSVLCIVIGFECYLYLQIYNKHFFISPINETEQSISINQKQLDAVIEDVATRALKREGLGHATSTLPDISN